jgi:hypothetical protein
MRNILLIILIIPALLFTGCSVENLEKPQSKEAVNVENENDINESIENGNTGEDKEKEESKESKEEKKEQETKEQKEEKKYIGQALDTLERDKIVEVYKEKNKNSEIVYRLKDYEEVELIETLPYGWFKVRLSDGVEGYVDALYVRTKEVPPHQYNEKIEGYALVFTHDDQTLRIYKDGELVKETIASSGLWDHFTPRGVFQIERGRRGKWAYIPRFKQGFKYWVGFKGVYLFHSIPYTEDGQVIEEEAQKLGQPASHGCIRLPVDVAKYIYENVPEGSLVLIY